MATNTSSETNKKSNWFTRIFSSKNSGSSSSIDHANSFSNPSFISLSDVLNRTADQHPSQRQLTIDESLLDIAVNAQSDVSSLADKSRGTIDFFHTPPVSEQLNKLFDKINFLNSLRHHQPNELIMLIGRQ